MAHIHRNHPTSVEKREQIIALWSSGTKQAQIAEVVGLSPQTVSNIVKHFLQHGKYFPGKPGWKERTVSTPEVVEFVEYCKITKPSTYNSEIRQALVGNGICTAANAPSCSKISDILRQDLNFTFKKLSVCPEESLSEENLIKMQDYIMFMAGVDPLKVHFFDESSVTKTTPNRNYGHSSKGQPAIEVKRYSSNATYTVNLLHSCFGVDYSNILEGPSNGLEMLHFFEESMDIVDPVYGNPVLANGDIIVMDNCGFHHGRFAEDELRRMLGRRGIELVFQPPYSPDFNTCEFCFRHMKLFLRKNEQFSQNYTELAIIEALQTVTPTMSQKFFQHCGFVI